MSEKPFYERMTSAIGGALLFSAMIVVAAPISAALGALAGWTVSLIFGDTILRVMSMVGIHDVAVWQLGATLGFVSSFLRTQTTVKAK